jgi:bifunctional non-homologous end joining protein LigD
MFAAENLRPMLATLPSAPPSLTDPNYVYEPKVDGIRAIVEVRPQTAQKPGPQTAQKPGPQTAQKPGPQTAQKPGPQTAQKTQTALVRIWSRNGNEKTAQFPDIVHAVGTWLRKITDTIVLDGEVVALDEQRRAAGFQRLQHRIHVTVPGFRSSKPILPPEEQPAAFVAFDLLRDGAQDLRNLCLFERRACLEALFKKHQPPSDLVRITTQSVGNGTALLKQAEKEGWEGLMVKLSRSPYRSARRSPEWLKYKLTKQDEFVICGWTDPGGSRMHFGSLVLGARGTHGLTYVGEVGTGFKGSELDRLMAMLKRIESPTSPFNPVPKLLSAKGRPHWVKPLLVAQIRYTEITDDGRLRHPAYLGLRDDKLPSEVTNVSRVTEGNKAIHSAGGSAGPEQVTQKDIASLIDQLNFLERARKNGRLTLPDGDTLEVTNLHKPFWPAIKKTKGDLVRHYVRMAPYILPVVDNRPLVMKRLPNGVEGMAFYQHRAPEPVPPGVRIETLPNDDVPARLIGGSLKTLIYMAQLASISQDPWFSTMDDLDSADQVAIDLDPQPGATFAQILDVAGWVEEELDKVKVQGFPKTSGSEGLHIYIPLPPKTPYEAGMLFCQIIATMVAAKHPKVATVERMVRRRKDGTVYVDYLQNIQGKTLACAYSARQSAFAGVSTPLTWKEIHHRPKPQDFTIDTIEARVKKVGDLWSKMRNHKGTDLRAAIEKLSKSGKRPHIRLKPDSRE